MHIFNVCYVTWSNNRSQTFNISNGVKHGSVVSPLLFNIRGGVYIDTLFLELRTSGFCYHVGLT